MTLDINRKKTIKNAYRITKVRDRTALRIRVPGGHLDAKFLDLIRRVAEEYGNGTIHVTTRQGFEIPGIAYEQMPEVNRLIAPLLRSEADLGVRIAEIEKGYPAAGTRNIAACIGNRVCPFANYDTTALALKVEKTVYPHDFHVKIALTGCPNDCIKAHLHDIGVIGMSEPQYNYDYCIGCQACVKNCKKRVTAALTMHKGKVKRDPRRCIGCGECVMVCPTQAWTRNPKKFYRLIIMGRTGKKNPRLAETFIEWADEEVVLAVMRNTYGFVEEHIDRSLPKEHVGYIVDRAGYHHYREHVLKDVKLNPEARVAETIEWSGYRYEKDAFLS